MTRFIGNSGFVVAIIAAVVGETCAAAVVEFDLSPPGVQQSPLQADEGSLTENFNSLSLGSLPSSGTLAVGTYSASGMGIFNADAWGGAGGTGRYASTGQNGTLSVSITPSKYVGFWWSAGGTPDVFNIYGTGNTLLGTFNTSAINAMLGPKASPLNVVATDGQTYSGALYYGNPNGLSAPGSNNEPYAYVNLRLSDPSLSFTAVEFSDLGFEFDNLTISPQYYDPLEPVPEPSTYAMALAGVACGGFSMWRRRKRA